MIWKSWFRIFYYFVCKCLVEFTGKTIWAWSFFCRKVFNHKCNFFNRYKLFRLFLLEWVLVFRVFQGICLCMYDVNFINIKLLIIFIFLWISVESVVVLFNLFQKLVIYAFTFFLLVSLARCYKLSMLSQSTSPYFFPYCCSIFYTLIATQMFWVSFILLPFLFNWLN